MDKLKYVDTSIGTVGSEQSESIHGGGKTYPGACLPGGMVQLSPDTVTGGDNGTGYNYCHDTIEGFSINHLSGIGWYGDLGNIQIMPVTCVDDLRSGSNREVPFRKGTRGWKSEFTHDSEVTEAGYYAVKLDRYNIWTEATVSMRTGLLRCTYPENENACLILNFSRRIGGRADFQDIRIANPGSVEGRIHCTPKGGGFGRGDGNISYDLYFVCEFSEPAEQLQFFENEEYQAPGLSCYSGADVGLIARFGKRSAPLVVRCGISYVDLDGARNNLRTECDDFDFDRMRGEAAEAWRKAFSGIQVDGTDETDLTLFYTCLYHVLLDPRTSMDCDGRFSLNGRILKTGDYTHRTVFSGWDVYRSEFPLLTVICPQMVKDEVCSLLKIAEEGNQSLPRWELLGIDSGCMVGDPGAIVVCDAAVKGIMPYDPETAYEIIRSSALGQKMLFGKPFRSSRPDCEAYLDGCYVPGKLSDTLEYLLADYAAARFAEKLGKPEDTAFFMSRAGRYPENFCRERGFMSPRDSEGGFLPEKDRYDHAGCVESNIFQQSWFVPYDVEGLSALFGEARTISLLEEFFANADLSRLWNEDYNHSNEPCHNITHYFTVLGLPHRTQYWTRRVQKEAYRTGAFGFCGNEDVGQLSAWYVLSALGFAQICPADGKYWFNTPLFPNASIKLSPQFHSCAVSNELRIECDRNPLDFPYIDAVFYNGRKVERNYLTYEELTAGGRVRFCLTDC